MGEIERIKTAYEKRARDGKSSVYTYFNKATLFLSQKREQAFLYLLKKYGVDKLYNKKILDVGCGIGGVLRKFVNYGAEPGHLFGIDLLPDRIRRAKELSPNMNFCQGNAAQLPFSNDYFDILIQFTVFTSVLDATMKKQIAEEMLRVLNPNGIILWYDFHVNNPKNPDVRGVKKKEIHNLFEGCKIHLKRITLAPPIARILVPISRVLCELLEKIPLLCTHYIGVIRKR